MTRPTPSDAQPYRFDRYINGSLMAEGVLIEKARTPEEAFRKAAAIASRGANGEAPVLVYRPTPSDAQPVAPTKPRCAKPGCGALHIVGHPCTDWDCPQQYVSAADYRAVESALDVERQKREAAERDRDGLRDEVLFMRSKAIESRERAEAAEASLAKANARIAESDWQPVETLPKDGRSVMVWLAATATERPHAFAPVSVCEDGSWWDDSTGDQIEPLSAVYWKAIQPPNALSNIEKERDDDR